MTPANGFILDVDGNDHSSLNKTIRLPEYPNTSLAHHTLSPGMMLMTWRAPVGDINFCTQKHRLLLILNGYISDGPGFNGGTSQLDCCHKIGKELGNGEIIEKLTTIVPNLSGSFAITVIDYQTKQVYTATDRIGSRPLWYAKSKDHLWISSHSVAIAQSRPRNEYRPGGIASFLLYGTQVEPSKCIFQGIDKVKEGTITELFINFEPKVHSYYRYKHHPEIRTKKEWITIAANRLVNAAGNIVEKEQKIGLFLSGGVDSRLVLSALIEAGIQPVLVTLSDSHNIETKIAQKVTRYFALPHEVIFRDQEWYLRSLPNAVYESNGVYDWTHAHFREACHQMYKNYGVDTYLLGDFSEAFSKLFFSRGNQNSMNLWKSSEFLRLFDSLMLPLYKPPNKKRTLFLLKPEYREAAIQELKQDIIARFRNLRESSKDISIVIDQFFRWQNAHCAPTFEMLLDVRSVACERNIMFDLKIHELLEVLPKVIL